ncbi:hypothetical protein DFQ26_002861 [Actinomortierella ambigua]|nr:hypothetical protein DFQ26_002861 [Actinomortierella ambigua]
MELEAKMASGIRLTDEESVELGKLSGAQNALLVKRDSCTNCAKDYQCALLSCDSFCKSRQNSRYCLNVAYRLFEVLWFHVLL